MKANKVYIQGMHDFMADKGHKQEPQLKWLCFTQPCMHPYISSSNVSQ